MTTSGSDAAREAGEERERRSGGQPGSLADSTLSGHLTASATTAADGIPHRLSARAQRLAASLGKHRGRRVYLRDLWAHFDAADPALRTTAARRAILADTLTELANESVLTLPARQSWDRTQKPALPRFITLPTAEQTPESRKTTVWHPHLAWVLEAPGLTPTQRGHLDAVNTWLHTNRDTLIVPHRERSLEIFGNEKTLDRLLTTSLFAPDRLTLALLRARRVAPRLTTERVGDGPVLLVAENSDTFHSLATVLRDNPGRVGMVGWGAGAGFEHSVLSVPRLGHRIAEIRYFGDLDKKGLQIPANADRVAMSEGLPPVQPAVALYEALLTHGSPHPGQPRLTQDTAEALVTWLPRHLQAPAAAHLTGGTRLAQEAAGLALLMTAEPDV